MIKILPVSGFVNNLPENQIIEEQLKEIIKRSYSLGGFTPLDTPVVERLEVLTSKGGDNNEIYTVNRFSGEKGDDAELGLRFDLTVPLARYVAEYEGELTFPFRRQHIARSYRGERPQKGRFREFYQADADIIGNGELPLFADTEVLWAMYSALRDINFGAFQININNRKFLTGFLDSLGIKNISEVMGVIDKKDKVKREVLVKMFKENSLGDDVITSLNNFIDFAENNDNEKILSYYSQFDNKMLKEGLQELKFVYNSLLDLGVPKEFLRINPAISRGLTYYTGMVFETFIEGAENLGSIASGGRYDNLASNFSKNNYPGVGGSIGLSRLIAVLEELGKIKPGRKTISEVLVLNMGGETLKDCLNIINTLRNAGINTEMYLSPDAKIQKQLKYANNKKIKYAIILGDDEKNRGVVQVKNLDTGEQDELKKEEIGAYINKTKLH